MLSEKLISSVSVWRVVIIEDSPEDRDEIRRLLLNGSDRHYQFAETETGSAGILAVLDTVEGPPDCVVLDYKLPDMDALEVLAAIVDPNGITACPVVVLTGYADARLGSAVLKGGAQDFIGKASMTAEGLTRALENATERWAMVRELHAKSAALQASEAQLQLAAEVAGLGVTRVDYQTHTIVLDDIAGALFGLTAGVPLPRQVVHGTFHPDDTDEISRRINESLDPTGDGRFSMEHRVVHRDGSTHWLFVREQVTFGNIGGVRYPVSSVLVAVDITERRRTDEALRESEARFRALTTASSDMVFRMTPDWSEMRPLDGLGVFASTKAGSRTWQHNYVHPEDQPTLMARIHDAIRTMSIFESEHRVRRMDDTWGWTCARAIPMLDMHGDIVEWFGTATDVTVRKEAELALQESTALLQAISDATGDVIFAKDREGRMTYANAATLVMIGKPLHDVLGKTGGELVDDASATRQVMIDDQRIMDSGISEELEEQFPLPDGTNRVWLSRKAPHRDVAGRVIGLLGVSRDITDRARLQLQLVQAEKLQAVGRLAGGIAHDFNNLLMVITGNLELMQEQLSDRLPADCIELSEVLGAADRARVLVEHLLTFSRRLPVAYQAVDIRALIAATTGLLQRTLGQEITIVCEVSQHDDLIVDGDAAVLEQVLLNLAFNARDAITSLPYDAGRLGGLVTFAARAVTMDRDEALCWAPLVAGRCIEIVVSDTGTGMSDDVRAKALEPFFTTKAIGEGTGLGLASVYGTVTNLNGAMQLESAVPHGAVVRLRFPAGALAVGVDIPSPPSAAGPVPQRALLFVDDDDAVRSVMLRMLRHAGHHVVEARNGQDALDRAQTMGEELAGVISDIRMPGMSGIEMVRTLRIVRPDVPVLFVSGNADATWIDEFGPNTALLTKPFAPSRLFAALEEVLSDRTTSR